jgi:hypothetical protein
MEGRRFALDGEHPTLSSYTPVIFLYLERINS